MKRIILRNGTNGISVVRVQAMKDKAVFAQMLVQQKPVRFRIDCGASANIVLCKHPDDFNQ